MLSISFLLHLSNLRLFVGKKYLFMETRPQIERMKILYQKFHLVGVVQLWFQLLKIMCLLNFGLDWTSFHNSSENSSSRGFSSWTDQKVLFSDFQSNPHKKLKTQFFQPKINKNRKFEEQSSKNTIQWRKNAKNRWFNINCQLLKDQSCQEFFFSINWRQPIEENIKTRDAINSVHWHRLGMAHKSRQFNDVAMHAIVIFKTNFRRTFFSRHSVCVSIALRNHEFT